MYSQNSYTTTHVIPHRLKFKKLDPGFFKFMKNKYNSILSLWKIIICINTTVNHCYTTKKVVVVF